MKNILLLLLLSAGFLRGQDSGKVYLIFDEPCGDSLPPNFRKMSDTFRRTADTILPTLYGLKSLNASGSSQFCAPNLPVIIKNINFKKIKIIDLRQESHGFADGLNVSWYGQYDWANLGRPRKWIEDNEEHLLDSLLNAKNIEVTRIIKKDKASGQIAETETVRLEVKDVQTEEELAEDFKLDYFRITVADHRQPEIEDVDRFIKFARNLKDTWLHFHCHAGDGRTTAFLAMYDMMRNSKKVSFRDIIFRQYLLGGIDLAYDGDFPNWDKRYAEGRTKFLKDFYDYCKHTPDNFNTLYSEWMKK